MGAPVFILDGEGGSRRDNVLGRCSRKGWGRRWVDGLPGTETGV